MDAHQLTTSPDTTEEVWKDIPGFPGYQVSDMGRVRSFWRSKGAALGTQGEIPGGKFIAPTPQRVLAGSLDKGGYHRLVLRRDGKNHYLKTHALVLENFIGPCPRGMQGCHGDGIRSHNWLKNLRWDTCKKNHQDRFEHGTDPSGERNGQSVLTEADVIQIRGFYAQGDYSYRELGKLFNVNPSNIGHIIRRRTWAHLPG